MIIDGASQVLLKKLIDFFFGLFGDGKLKT